MSESEIQRRLAVVEEIRRLSYEMRAPHPLALGAVLAEYERRITMEAAAMGAAVSEIVRLRTELEQARDAIGRGWLVGGVSLAEAIRMKTRALEQLAIEQHRAMARLEARCHALEEQLGKLTELYDVTQARLEAFEEQEPDARTCAEWAATVALKSSDVHSAARRYLCGEQRGIVAQVADAIAEENP